MKGRLISLFYLITFLISKIIFYFRKSKKKTKRVFEKLSNPFNIFYPPTRIGCRIYLGSCVQASDNVFLKSTQISHIVNVSNEIPNFYTKHFYYHNLRINDNGLESINKEQLDKAMSFIEKALLNKNNKVLIHCYSGRSRSVTILTYYLANKFKISIDKIIQYLSIKRPIINPSIIFYQNLKNICNERLK